MAHRIVACAGGFGSLQNPMKFLPYFGGPAVWIPNGPRRPAAHRRWADARNSMAAGDQQFPRRTTRQNGPNEDIAMIGDNRQTARSSPRIRPVRVMRMREVVRAEGLEPPQLSSLEPKSSASTNSATPARRASSSTAMPRAAAYNMRHSLAAIIRARRRRPQPRR
jgi:hypothetical protein